MKGVLEGQCGQQNALVGLSNTFGTSNQRIAPSSAATASLMPTSSFGEQMANEFLRQQAKSGAPTSFSMKSMQQNLPQSSHASSSSSSQLAHNWSSEFQPRQNNLAHQWSQQYTAPATRGSYDSAWQTAKNQSIVQNPQHNTNSGMWSSEYLDNFETSLQKSWADDFLNGSSSATSSAVPDNFLGSHNEFFDKTWQDIQQETNTTLRADDYVYQENNPFLTSNDPLNDGHMLMRQGDIGNAMLAYEAAVKQNPQDAKAWCSLGLAHAENEKDQNAIQAFKKCLDIEPNHKEAILAMSVSLANEGLENEALHQLDKWISAYVGSDVSQITQTPPLYASFLDTETFNRVENRFLNAARQQGATPDPDLQNALGILYNLNRNFMRAVDSLKLAISKNPEDPRLWNRLGATLANGDRSAEAISAYREALNRYPTYVRARYNLGISCMQLQTYREALNHFVSALELQKGGNDASSIWGSMRSAAIRTDNAPDALLRAVETRNLSEVKQALQAMI